MVVMFIFKVQSGKGSEVQRLKKTGLKAFVPL
jgi:hypothetical protein